MKICQSKWVEGSGWTVKSGAPVASPQLVFVFGATSLLKRADLIGDIQKQNPGALLFGCSTAVRFEHTEIRAARVKLAESGGSRAASEELALALPHLVSVGGKTGGLNHVMILSDGLKANGSELVAAMIQNLPAGEVVTGGLAGDGARFGETVVLWEGSAQTESVVALAFYGGNLSMGYGAFGGWDPFGPERRITKARGNVLYELDEPVSPRPV